MGEAESTGVDVTPVKEWAELHAFAKRRIKEIRREQPRSWLLRQSFNLLKLGLGIDQSDKPRATQPAAEPVPEWAKLYKDAKRRRNYIKYGVGDLPQEKQAQIKLGLESLFLALSPLKITKKKPTISSILLFFTIFSILGLTTPKSLFAQATPTPDPNCNCSPYLRFPDNMSSCQPPSENCIRMDGKYTQYFKYGIYNGQCYYDVFYCQNGGLPPLGNCSCSPTTENWTEWLSTQEQCLGINNGLQNRCNLPSSRYYQDNTGYVYHWQGGQCLVDIYQCGSSPVCPWDIIKTGASNGKVDAADLAEINRCYSPLGGVATGCQTSDLNNNGVVNALDYSILLTHWGTCPAN